MQIARVSRRQILMHRRKIPAQYAISPNSIHLCHTFTPCVRTCPYNSCRYRRSLRLPLFLSLLLPLPIILFVISAGDLRLPLPVFPSQRTPIIATEAAHASVSSAAKKSQTSSLTP